MVLQTKRKLFRAKLGWVSPLAEAAWPDGDMIGDTDLQFGSKRNVLFVPGLANYEYSKEKLSLDDWLIIYLKREYLQP